MSVDFGQSDLHHRIQCTDLDDDEVKCLQAYLTIILENRNSKETSDLATTAGSNCMVLEMEDKELRKFAHYIGEKGIRLFRAIVKSDNSQTQTHKLAIVGENGMRVFPVLVQGGGYLNQKNLTNPDIASQVRGYNGFMSGLTPQEAAEKLPKN